MLTTRPAHPWLGRLLLTLALAGCDGGDKTSATDDPTTSTSGEESSSGGSSSGGESSSSGGSSGEPTTGAVGPTFTEVQAIFTAKCSCHLVAPGIGNGQMELTEGKAYANIVGVFSSEATTTNRVEPGDPSKSYLYLKLTGDYLMVMGGGGDPMPLVGGPLTPEELATIEGWISAGALDN